MRLFISENPWITFPVFQVCGWKQPRSSYPRKLEREANDLHWRICGGRFFFITHSQCHVKSFSFIILRSLQIYVNHQVFNELASQPPRKKSRGDSEDWRLSGASIGGKGVFTLKAQILQVFLFTFLPHLKGKKTSICCLLQPSCNIYQLKKEFRLSWCKTTLCVKALEWLISCIAMWCCLIKSFFSGASRGSPGQSGVSRGGQALEAYFRNSLMWFLWFLGSVCFSPGKPQCHCVRFSLTLSISHTLDEDFCKLLE